jgi:nickel/cobalt exporter
MRAHAHEVEARVGAGRASAWRTILFGLSGGLVPCPAAVTVLLLCLNLGQVALGATLVVAFSAGLALTLITVGVAAAVGLKFLSARTSRLNGLFAAAPWLSGALIVAVGLAFMALGWIHPIPPVG